MGYIRKHKAELRSGFEAIMMIGVSMLIAPTMIILQAASL